MVARVKIVSDGDGLLLPLPSEVIQALNLCLDDDVIYESGEHDRFSLYKPDAPESLLIVSKVR
jgi:hypothetical protein